MKNYPKSGRGKEVPKEVKGGLADARDQNKDNEWAS